MDYKDHSFSDFLERLKTRKRELEDALNRLLKDQKEYHHHTVGHGVADESDEAQREILTFSNYGLIDRKSKELRQIEYLIQKVSRDEDFGICEECEDPIPMGRLLIVPEATLCVHCQSEMEEFACSRKQSNGTSFGYRGMRAQEWKPDNNSDDFDDDLVDSGLEIYSDFELAAPGSGEESH